MRSLTLLSACALCATLAFSQQLVKGPVVVLIGPPASGKTTQAAAAAKYLNVPVVSVESLIRDNAAAFEKDRTKGLTGMEPETDPMLTDSLRHGSRRVTFQPACSWMDIRTR